MPSWYYWVSHFYGEVGQFNADSWEWRRRSIYRLRRTAR